LRRRSGDIAARMRQAGDQARADRVSGQREDNGDR
jgi:hypothetical protein